MPPWLDLPDYLTEKILERLPLSDYVRIPAVCRRWRSIQTEHRRRHAPSPPPMVRLPWLIPWQQSEVEATSCYSPFEGRTYRIQIPSHFRRSLANCGWLLRPDAVFNPISRVEIPFYQHLVGVDDELTVVAVSPPPDLVVFVVENLESLLVFRPGDLRWTKLQLPITDEEFVSEGVTIGGRFYCISSCDEESSADHLMIVDPTTTPPTVCSYRMEYWEGCAQIEPELESEIWCNPKRLVESDGEVLMVMQFSDGWFRVFRPDVSERMWTRVESLGDRLLLFYSPYVVSLIAADAGLKKNCIYFQEISGDYDSYIWKVFDLDAGTVTEAPHLNASLRDGFIMFLPSIC